MVTKAFYKVKNASVFKMIFGYRQRIYPDNKLPYQGQKPCRKKSWVLNTLPNGLPVITIHELWCFHVYCRWISIILNIKNTYKASINFLHEFIGFSTLIRGLIKWATRLVWWHTKTRHEKGNKFPSHTWLPYLTPNGVTH